SPVPLSTRVLQDQTPASFLANDKRAWGIKGQRDTFSGPGSVRTVGVPPSGGGTLSRKEAMSPPPEGGTPTTAATGLLTAGWLAGHTAGGGERGEGVSTPACALCFPASASRRTPPADMRQGLPASRLSLGDASSPGTLGSGARGHRKKTSGIWLRW